MKQPRKNRAKNKSRKTGEAFTHRLNFIEWMQYINSVYYHETDAIISRQ